MRKSLSRWFGHALVIGILIGTYSSIAIAAPILVAYQEWRAGRGKTPISMPVDPGKRTKAKANV